MDKTFKEDATNFAGATAIEIIYPDEYYLLARLRISENSETPIPRCRTIGDDRSVEPLRGSYRYSDDALRLVLGRRFSNSCRRAY